MLRFVGPGLLVSCAYIDPGNYSTSTAAGAQYHYSHMFIIVLSNCFAVVLQCLCIKLGTVTGLDLAENCRAHLPAWLNFCVYVLAELAVIFTDMAEVIGSAIAFKILLGIKLRWGVVLTIVDVLAVVFAYNPDGSMKHIRKFEIFVSSFVILTFGCFVLLLQRVNIESYQEIFEGMLPSKVLFKDKNAVYLALGIIGATVMPHSLYLGSNIVKPRLKEFDNAKRDPISSSGTYRPSFSAIKYCLDYSYIEMILSLCVIAIFINSSILIVSAAALFGKEGAADADLITIYDLLCQFISTQAGFIFALAMFFSSIAAGIICTMSGMMIAEGSINWTLSPFLRRLITRSISILPCLLMAVFSGREGIAVILNLSQVVLSLLLPFVTAPLLYFTSNKKIMSVVVRKDESHLVTGRHTRLRHELVDETTSLVDSDHYAIIDYSNNKWMNIAGFLAWGITGFLNLYLILQWFKGEDINF